MKYHLSNMLCLDIYLSSLTNDEYKKIEHKILPSNPKSVPLLSWDIYAEDYYKKLIEGKKTIEKKEVFQLAKKFNWANDLSSDFSKNDYEALIITDINQKIIWVNEGFSKMTGYSKKFAINKTPKFLQGNNTSLETKNRLRNKLLKQEPFKEIIVNYKKDKTPYHCEVKIIPLYNKQTTHFIAFEKQVI